MSDRWRSDRGAGGARRRGRSARPRSRCSPRSSSSPPAGSSTSSPPARSRATCSATRSCSSRPSSAPTCSRWASARGCRAISSASWRAVPAHRAARRPGRRPDAGAAVRRCSRLAPASFRVAALRAGARRRHRWSGSRSRCVMRILKRHAGGSSGLKTLVSQVLTFDYLGALAVSIAFPLLLVPQLGPGPHRRCSSACSTPASRSGRCGCFARELRAPRARMRVACGADARRAGRRVRRRRSHHARWPRTSFYADRSCSTARARPTSASSSRAARRRAPVPQRQPAVPSRDEYRYHEALVHPALAAHGAPRQVLVLGGGDGMAVREMLRYPSVERVTLVELDPDMTRLFSTTPLLRAPERRRAALAQGARSSTPTRSPGSSSTTRCFDVDRRRLPRPDQLLDRQALHHAPSTSCSTSTCRPAAMRWCRPPRRCSRARASGPWSTTIEAAGSAPTPYHAHVPSFGEWGFVIASRRPFRLPRPLPAGLRFLDAARPAGAVRLSARHGARAGRGEPAVEPGAGADLRGRVGQGAAMMRAAARADPARRLPRAGGAGAARRLRRSAGVATTAAGSASRRARPSAARRRAAAAGARRRCTRRASACSSSAAASPAWRRRGRCGAPASTTVALLELEDTAGGNSRGDAIGGHALPARRALPAGAGRRARRGAGPARRTRPAPARRRPLRSTTSASLPQPAGAPLHRRRLARRPAAADRRACGAGRRWRSTAPSRTRSARCGATARFAIPTARARWRRRSPRSTRSPSPPGSTRTASATRTCAGTSTTAAATTTAPAAAQVSAWAGMHYFASRHGFRAPGDDEPRTSASGVLTWPEGNAWLAERLAAPLGERLQPGRVVLAHRRGPRTTSRWTPGTPRRSGVERWQAARASSRRRSSSPRACCRAPPSALRRAARRDAPCALAGRQPAARRDRSTTGPARRRRGTTWSTARSGLGYVDAMHQSTRPFAARRRC